MKINTDLMSKCDKKSVFFLKKYRYFSIVIYIDI